MGLVCLQRKHHRAALCFLPCEDQVRQPGNQQASPHQDAKPNGNIHHLGYLSLHDFEKFLLFSTHSACGSFVTETQRLFLLLPREIAVMVRICPRENKLNKRRKEGTEIRQARGRDQGSSHQHGKVRVKDQRIPKKIFIQSCVFSSASRKMGQEPCSQKSGPQKGPQSSSLEEVLQVSHWVILKHVIQLI